MIDIKAIIKILYVILILSFILPSGTFLFLPIKTLVSIVLLFLVFFDGKKKNLDKYNVLTLVSFGGVILWSVIAVLNGFSATIIQFIKSFFSLIFIVWITKYLVDNKYFKPQKILNLFIVVSIILVATKILLSGLMTLNVLKMDFVVQMYKNVFKTDLTTMLFPVGNVTVYRMMISTDSIPYIVFSFYLLNKNKSKFKKFCVILIMCIYTFIIFSRVIIIQFAAILLLALYITIRRKVKNQVYLLISFAIGGIVLIVGGIVLLNSNNQFVEAILYRFKGSATQNSDSIRTEQFEYLFTGFKSNILIGHGTGSYVKEYIRSTTLMYSYELEYVSFLYQFGIIGFVMIIVVTIINFYKICLDKQLPRYIYLMILLHFLIWIFKPFLNPNFLSSNSGFIIVGLYLYKSFHLEKTQYIEELKIN